MNEQYIFLGIQQNCWFFIHQVVNEEFKKETSYKIMNCLINDRYITEKNITCIIYEINIKCTECNVIVIQHQTSEHNYTFSKKTLEEQFDRLLSTDRKDDKKVLIFEYDYNIKAFYRKEIKHTIEKTENNNIKINDISYVQCLKPFN